MGELQQDALTDGLTELNNQRTFDTEFRREVARASRCAEPLSLALIDIDRFKDVNDTLGAFGSLLLEGREQDRFFRVGGDKFAIILPAWTAPSRLPSVSALWRWNGCPAPQRGGDEPAGQRRP